MNEATATVRELRLDFRAVKRKIEEHGSIVITDNGVPSYVMKPVERLNPKPQPMPDYYGRLLKQQPKALSAKATRELQKENRGER
jgi:hypothetical protein